MGQETSQESQLVPPQKVFEAVKPKGMEARIEEDDLPRIPRRWIFGKNCLNIFS
jgi:hypothetical protein